MKDGGESLVVVMAYGGGQGWEMFSLNWSAVLQSAQLTSPTHAYTRNPFCQHKLFKIARQRAAAHRCYVQCSYWVDFVYFTTFAWIQIQIGLIWKRWVSLTLSSSLYIHKVNYLYFLHQMCIQRVCNQIIYEMLRMLLFPTLWMMKISHGQTDPRALLLVLVELDC